MGAVGLDVAKPSQGVGAINCNETHEANLGLRPLSANLADTAAEEISQHSGFTARDVDVQIACAPPAQGSVRRITATLSRATPGTNRWNGRPLDAEAWKSRYGVVENVMELLRGRHTHQFQRLHRNLTRLGCEVCAEIHNPVDFGLPQSRIRWLIVAKLGGSFHRDLPGVNLRPSVHIGERWRPAP